MGSHWETAEVPDQPTPAASPGSLPDTEPVCAADPSAEAAAEALVVESPVAGPPAAESHPASALRWWLAGWMLALAARALWVTLVLEPSRAVFSDMAGHFNNSTEMLEHARWSPYVFFQGAGYPLALACLRRLWANDQDFGLVAAWVQIAGSLAALACSVELARQVAGRRWAGVALAVGALHVPWLFFNSVYMAEALYSAALAALGIGLVALARDPAARWRRTLLLGVVAGLAAWLKGAHLPIGPIAAVLWLFPLRRGWRGAARIVVGWVAGVALALWIPHGVLTSRLSGRTMTSPPSGGLNFVEGKCPSKENKDSNGYGYWSPMWVQAGVRNTKTWPRPFLDQGYFYAEGVMCIAQRPAVLVESFDYIRKLFLANELWPANAAGNRGTQLNAAWARIVEWPLVLGVILAFAFAVARARSPRPSDASGILWLALAAPALSLFSVAWLWKSELRYRVPFDVFFFPLALWGWKELAEAAGRGWRFVRSRARRASGPREPSFS